MSAEPVSLVMIVRNGQATLDRCLRSVFEGRELVSEAVVVRGGVSGDATDDILTEWAARAPIRVLDLPPDIRARALEGDELVDFAAARNYAHSQAANAWQFWLDCDDVVPSPARVREVLSRDDSPSGRRHGEIGGEQSLGEVAAGLPPRVSAVWMPYHYLIEPETDRVLVTHRRERMLRWADGFLWVDPIHEVLTPIGGNHYGVETCAYMPNFWIEHRPVRTEAEREARNWRILERMKPLGEIRWRVAYYIADHYGASGQFEEAARWYDKAVALAGNPEEAYLTYCNAFRSAMRAGKVAAAENYALHAFGLQPERIEALAAMVQLAAAKANAPMVAVWYEKYRQSSTPAGGSMWAAEVRLLPHLCAAPLLGALGRYEDALAACDAALAFEPRHPEAKRLRRLAERLTERDAARKALRTVASYARSIGDHEAVEALRRYAPAPIAEAVTTPPRPEPLRYLRVVPPRDGCPADVPCLAPGDGARGGDTEIAAMLDRVVAEGWERLALVDVWPRLDRPAVLTKLQGTTLYLTTPLEEAGDDGLRSETLESWRDDLSAIGDLEHLTVAYPDDRSLLTAWLRAGCQRVGPRVDIYAPHFVEPWGPTSPEGVGSGASEAQIVELARWLSRRGFRVSVWAAPLSLQVDQSVTYRPCSQWDHRQESDLLLAHRAPWIASRADIGAKRLWIWLHDQPESHSSTAFLPHVQARVGRYVALTETMRIGYEQVHHVSRLARLGYLLPSSDLEDVGDLAETPSAAYISAPYRGLLELLRCWPTVRAAVPEATLEAAYGWQVHDALTQRDGSGSLRKMREQIEKLLDQPGVKWHGRLGRSAVRNLLDRSRVWAYPSTYEEMLCEAGQRAQARACWPVAVPRAALAETIYGGDLVAADVATEEGRAQYTQALVAALTASPESLREGRLALRERALAAHHQAEAAWTTALREAGLL